MKFSYQRLQFLLLSLVLHVKHAFCDTNLDAILICICIDDRNEWNIMFVIFYVYPQFSIS